MCPRGLGSTYGSSSFCGGNLSGPGGIGVVLLAQEIFALFLLVYACISFCRIMWLDGYKV
jgi:hypothetical protein